MDILTAPSFHSPPFSPLHPLRDETCLNSDMNASASGLGIGLDPHTPALALQTKDTPEMGAAKNGFRETSQQPKPLRRLESKPSSGKSTNADANGLNDRLFVKNHDLPVSRHEPSVLRFVTTTRPSQMKDRTVRKHIRQHVMLNHANQKRRSMCQRVQPPSERKVSPSRSVRAGESHDKAIVDAFQSSPSGLHSLDNVLGSRLDAFNVLPQFPQTGQTIEEILFNFATSPCDTLSVLDSVMSSRLACLSTTSIAASRDDVMRGASRDSFRTMSIKHELMHELNIALANPAEQTSNSTILVLAKLIISELISGNFDELQTHTRGLDLMLMERGGLNQLNGNHYMPSLISSISLLMNVLGETQPNEMHMAFAGGKAVLQDDLTETFYSPLYWPETEPQERLWGKACSEFTYKILIALRNLTNFVLANTRDPEISITSTKRRSINKLAFGLKERLSAMPSAMDPTSPVAGDLVYETCRLAALLYVTAIADSTPFSATAASLEVDGQPLLYRLIAVLAQTDLRNSWGKMCGCLVFVTMIVGAATHGHNSPKKAMIAGPRRLSLLTTMNATDRLVHTRGKSEFDITIKFYLAMIDIQRTLTRSHDIHDNGCG